MIKSTKKPLDFGAILDRTFLLVKENFVPFFTIMLIITGPYYLFSLLSSVAYGSALIRQPLPTTGDAFEDFLNRITGVDQTQTADFPFQNINTGFVIFAIISGLLAVILVPMAKASIIVAIGKAQNGESFGVKETMKQAFSRFWPLLGSSIVYGLCIAGILIGTSFLFTFIFILPAAGVALDIIIILGTLCLILYLAVRWSFYFPAVIFEKVAPGLGESWRLTRKNFWRLVGLFIVVFLITSIISGVVNAVVNNFLGGSILSELIGDIVAIIADMISYTGFAVVFFDLRVRNSGEDLTELIDEYDESDPENPLD